MILSAQAVQNGTQIIGDFVMLHVFLMQLAQPLGFIGAVYREIRQALTDIGRCFGFWRSARSQRQTRCHQSGCAWRSYQVLMMSGFITMQTVLF
ncbi:MAG: hypothetical protein CM15mP95_2820 [Alphaproteobacteria bacterium]|nr:MAG: hypothetical protein CM15mP95_2820 [Alphaproteobacteria bacterium]